MLTETLFTVAGRFNISDHVSKVCTFRHIHNIQVGAVKSLEHISFVVNPLDGSLNKNRTILSGFLSKDLSVKLIKRVYPCHFYCFKKY